MILIERIREDLATAGYTVRDEYGRLPGEGDVLLSWIGATWRPTGLKDIVAVEVVGPPPFEPGGSARLRAQVVMVIEELLSMPYLLLRPDIAPPGELSQITEPGEEESPSVLTCIIVVDEA